jgi:homoserine dehydrogenase
LCCIAKYVVFVSRIFNVQFPDCLSLQGITAVSSADLKAASAVGGRVKLVGVAAVADDGNVTLQTRPCVLPKESPLAQLPGRCNHARFCQPLLALLLLPNTHSLFLPFLASLLGGTNCVSVTCDPCGELFFRGVGGASAFVTLICVLFYAAP